MRFAGRKCVRAAGVVIGLLLLAPGASADITWQVQSDFGPSTTTRSMRGIALSPDGANVYVGFIQGTSGTTKVAEFSSGIIGGTNPAPTNSVSLSGLQPKGLAVDDRGLVYATDSNSAGANSQKFSIFSSDLLTTEATVTTATVGPPAYQLGGIEVQKVGGNYYAYVASNKGAATIERWNVNTPTAPVLDTSWASGGILNLKTTQGSNAFVNGLTIAVDGTIYATGGVLSTGRGDSVFKISADATSITSTSVDQALDVALYNGALYVVQYKNSSSDVAVLDASSLASLGTLTPGFSRISLDDTGYAGIAVSPTGQLYVSDEIYAGTTGNAQDRVLVSTTVPEPATLTLIVAACATVYMRRSRISG